MLNTIIDTVLQRWENEKEIELSYWCQCFEALKTNLETTQNKNESFLKNLNIQLLEKIIKLTSKKNDKKEEERNTYFFLVLVTFLLDIEYIFLSSSPNVLRCSEYYQTELDFFQNGKRGELMKKVPRSEVETDEKKKDKYNDDNITRNTLNNHDPTDNCDSTMNTNKNQLNGTKDMNKKEKKHKHKHTSEGCQQKLNYFTIIDTLIKNALDIQINDERKNEFLNFQICCFYSIARYFYQLSTNGAKFVHVYLKYMKHICSFILNTNFAMACDQHITHFMYKIIFFMIHGNIVAIKESEKEFIRFLFLLLNMIDAPLKMIKSMLILYLKKRNSVKLNSETYEELSNYASTNVELFLKYSKKENLFSFIHVLDICAEMIHNNIGNNEDNIIYTRNINYGNTDLNLNNWITDINKVLDRIGKITKEYLLGEKNIDPYLNRENLIYREQYTKKTNQIKDILDSLQKTKNKNKNSTLYNASFVNLQNGTEVNTELFMDWNYLCQSTNMQKPYDIINRRNSMNNLFTYVIKHVFSFFRTIIMKLPAENIGICVNSFTSFIKRFFLFNNINDLFLTYFIHDALFTYSEEVTDKYFPVFGNLLHFCSHFFLLANELIVTSWNHKIESGKFQQKLHLPKKEPEIEKEEKSEKGKLHPFHVLSKISEITNDSTPSIYRELYIHIARMLLFFLKNLPNYTKEFTKQELLAHYAQFIFYVFSEMTNPNYENIFQNTMSCYVTLQILYCYIKTTNLKFENLHKIHCSLNTLEQKLNEKEQGCSFFYDDKIFNNIHYIKKIKTFLMKHLDSISAEKSTSLYQKQKERELKRKFGVVEHKRNEREKNKIKKKKKTYSLVGGKYEKEEWNIADVDKEGEQKKMPSFTCLNDNATAFHTTSLEAISKDALTANDKRAQTKGNEHVEAKRDMASENEDNLDDTKQIDTNKSKQSQSSSNETNTKKKDVYTPKEKKLNKSKNRSLKRKNTKLISKKENKIKIKDKKRRSLTKKKIHNEGDMELKKTKKKKEKSKTVKIKKKKFSKNLNHVASVTTEEVLNTIKFMKESIEKTL